MAPEPQPTGPRGPASHALGMVLTLQVPSSTLFCILSFVTNLVCPTFLLTFLVSFSPSESNFDLE